MVQEQLFDTGPSVVLCPRCGRRCKYARNRRDDDRPMRKVLEGEKGGMCVNCVVTEIFKFEEPFCEMVESLNVAEAFRLPHVQTQFSQICVAGGAVEAATEIDWLEVIANWALPFPKQRRKRKP